MMIRDEVLLFSTMQDSMKDMDDNACKYTTLFSAYASIIPPSGQVTCPDAVVPSTANLIQITSKQVIHMPSTNMQPSSTINSTFCWKQFRPFTDPTPNKYIPEIILSTRCKNLAENFVMKLVFLCSITGDDCVKSGAFEVRIHTISLPILKSRNILVHNVYVRHSVCRKISLAFQFER